VELIESFEVILLRASEGAATLDLKHHRDLGSPNRKNWFAYHKR
jgi:hypothetical protein